MQVWNGAGGGQGESRMGNGCKGNGMGMGRIGPRRRAGLVVGVPAESKPPYWS